MTKKAQKLFGTSGIRGSIDNKVTPDLALGLGQALGTFLKGEGTVGIGTDYRTSKEMLKHAFLAGLASTGVDIIDLGIATMPAVAFHSDMKGISASVIITASHNPPTDNGFKVFISGREFIRSEEEFLENRIRSRDFLVANWKNIGHVTKWDIRTPYLKKVKEFVLRRGGRGEGAKVLLDLANGAAVDYTPHLLRELSFSVTSINSHPDGHFPGRPAEPSPKNLQETMQIAADADFAVTIAHDGDGDRIAVIDEDGRFIDQNRVIALFAQDEVKRKGGGTVVVSIDTSSVIDELVTAAGGDIVRMPLGSLQEELSNRPREEIALASEPWKPIFPELGYWMDGVAGAARFAQMVVEEGEGSCIKLMKSIPEYPMLRDFIQCEDALKACFISEVKETLVSELRGVDKVLEVDGIRVECTDGSYVLIRPSGTEPKARIYIGARTQTTLDNLEKEARDVMQRAMENCKKK
jgi:phosphoglucosamine mutase